MPEEVYDLIHRLTYQVNDDKLKDVSNEIASQINRLDTLGKRAKALSDAYDRTASNEIAKREKIRRLIVQTQAAIEKEGDAIEHTLLNNKELNNALQKQTGLIGALDQRLELLRQRRDRAFDPDRIKQYNKLIAESEQRRSVYTQSQPSPGGLSAGGLVGGVAIGSIAANLFTSAASALKGFATDVVATTQKYEKLSALLANTLGGKNAGDMAFRLLTDFAAETPFQLDELTAAYLKLINRGIKPTKEELTAFGDIAAAQGKSFDQFTEAILDATTGEFERLKEFGIKAKQAGDQVTLSFGNITKTVPKSADAIKRALLEIRNEAPGIAGAMKVISNTIEGQLSNLGDGFDRLKSSIGERFQSNIKSSLSAVSDLVTSFNRLVEIPVEDKLESERIEINALVLSLTDANLSAESRSAIMTELNSKYPELLRNIDLESASQEKLLGFLDSINLAYRQKIKYAALSRNAEAANEDAIKAQQKEQEAVKGLAKELEKLGLSANGLANLTREQIASAGKEITNLQGNFVGTTADKALKLFDAYKQAQAELNAATNEGQTAERELATEKAKDATENAKRIADANAGIAEYTRLLDAAKTKLSNLPDNVFNTFDRNKLKTDIAIFTAELQRLQGIVGGTINATTTPTATTPAATTKKATTAEEAAKKREKAYQDALKKESDRFEKDRAQLEEKYNRQRLDARTRFADDDIALSAELLRIKEEQEAEAFQITTDRETSHQNELLAIQKKYRGLKSTEYAKASADIIKSKEDEAARLKVVQDRSDAELLAARKKAQAEEVARNKDIISKVDKSTAAKLAEIENTRNLAILGANTISGGKSIDQDKETEGVSNILEARLKIPKDKAGKLAEDSFKQLTGAINQYYDTKKLEIEISQIDVKLNDPNLNIGLTERAALEKAKTNLQVQLANLQQNTPTVPKELNDHLAKAADDYSTLAQAGVSAYQQIAEASQKAADAQIAAQERRVEQARRIADRGNAELLQMEEKRLEEANKKKAAAAQTEMAINAALALSNSIVAVAKAASAGAGYASIATVAAVLGALAAGYAFVRTLSADTPAFKDGVIDLQGPGTTKSDSIHARLSRGESVMTAEATERYKPLLQQMNEMKYRPELPNYDNSLTQKAVDSLAASTTNYKNDFNALRKEVKTLAKAMAANADKPNTSTITNAKQFASEVGREIQRTAKNKNL